MAVLKAWINPLRFVRVEVPGAEASPPNPDAILGYLVTPGVDGTPEAIVRRYREAVPASPVLAVAPVESTLLDKLVWPLRNAIGSYTLGNYLGAIALAGMVGEMVAILLWDISRLPAPGKAGEPMSDAEQVGLFGSTFERLGQDRRTAVLRAAGLCDDGIKRAFDELRTVRKRHLHLLSHSSDAARDAKHAVALACEVVQFVMGQSFEDGSVRLRPELMAYLDARGAGAEVSATPGARS